MDSRHSDYLARASGALSRRDYLTAMQFGLRAAGAPGHMALVRCDAQLVLALTSLELGAPVEALAYAVGAHLTASRAGDSWREEQAAALLETVVVIYPYLRDQYDALTH